MTHGEMMQVAIGTAKKAIGGTTIGHQPMA